MPLPPHNPNPCFFMHLDMNASFASANQQAFPLWRGKPLGITPVNVPGRNLVPFGCGSPSDPTVGELARFVCTNELDNNVHR